MPAGVLVPLYRRGGSWHLLLCRRSDSLREHQGEVAFPGGRLEPGDADLVQCALREAHEEVGLKPTDVAVTGALDSVNTRTGYQVWPTVATVPDSYQFVPSKDEVATLLEVPIDWLLDERSLRSDARLHPDGTLTDRGCYVFGPHLIFGATASIITQLLGLYRQSTAVAQS
jgi:8-oxo-dGTP pyrophosphatase MutT (NUDIX family)